MKPKSHTEFEMIEIFLCQFKPWVLSHHSNGGNSMAYPQGYPRALFIYKGKYELI